MRKKEEIPKDRYQSLLNDGTFEIFHQTVGPDVFVVHRIGRYQKKVVLHERISIDPQTGIGRSDNPLVAKEPLLSWIRQKTRWTPDEHDQWIKNERAIPLSNVPVAIA